MANPFDQFDNPAPKAAGNPFDQFDSAPSQKTSVGANPFDQFDNAPSKEPKQGVLDRLGHDVHGAFMGAVSNGFGGLVARKGFELSGYGMDTLRDAYPGMDESWYKQKQKALIASSQNELRQEASKEQADNAFNINIPNPFHQKTPQDLVAESMGVKHTGDIKVDPLAFAAGVVGSADPTWAVNPAAAVPQIAALKTGGRIAANAAAHAAFGGLTDAAYQTADILDGLQKDYDVKRTLESAGFQGAFGGAQAAAPLVSDLFKKRGIDTTPRPDPREGNVTTPITDDMPPPAFIDKAREVMHTGNEADIHALFDGSNIPAPWRADIHNYVKQRDARLAGGESAPDIDLSAHTAPPPEGRNSWDKTRDEAEGIRKYLPEVAAADERLPQDPRGPAEGPVEAPQIAQEAPQAARLSPPTAAPVEAPARPAAEEHLAATQAHVENLTKDWKNAPGFEVVGSHKDIADPYMREAMRSQDPDGTALGLYGKDGKVRIFADNIHDPDLLSSVVYHEALGHHGLSEKFGAKLDQDLTTLMDRNVGKFGKAVDKWMDENPGDYGGSRVRAAEEVLAEMSENGQIKPSVADALSKAVRDFGRKAGLKLKYSDNEIKYILSMAHEAVVSGHGRNVGLNGFRVRPGMVPANPIDENGTFDARNMKARPTAKDIGDETWEWLSMGYKPKPGRTWEQAKKMAEDANVPPELIKEHRDPGNIDRTAFIYARAREVNEAAMRDLGAKVEAQGHMTDEDIGEQIRLYAQNDYILGRISNIGTQLGRGLNAMKAVGYTKNQLLKLREELHQQGSHLEELTDPEFAGKLLKQYLALLNGGNPAGAQAQLNLASRPYWWQHILSYRMNMMLSGLSTHLKSTMDMATTMGNDLMENAVASAVGGPIRAGLRATGRNVELGAHPTEVAMRVWGLVRAGLDAQTYADSAAAFKSGHGARFLNSGTVPNPESPGILSWPTRAIGVQDQFFRTVLGNSEMYNLGARRAYQELRANKKPFTNDDVFNLGSSYALQDAASMTQKAKAAMDAAYTAQRTPTAAEWDAYEEAKKATDTAKTAKGNAEQTMLMNKSPVNDAIDTAKRIRPGMGPVEQAGKFAINFMTPFIKVSSNALMNQIVRRSPLFLLDPVGKADFMAGGARRDIAVARAAMGSARLGFYWWAADKAKDKMTGEGSDNPNKVAELKAGGWSPNSVHENGKYSRNSNLNLSLNPLDTHNNLATMVAGVRHAFEDGASTDDTVLGLRLAYNSIVRGLTEQSYIGDLVPGAQTVLIPEKGQQGVTKQNQFAQDQAKTFVPNLLNQAAKIADPNLHDTRDSGMLGAVKAAIPGLTGSNPVSYNVYGQPMKTGTSVSGIHSWFSNGNGTEDTKDPTEMELQRLAKLTPAAVVTPVQRTLSLGKDWGLPAGTKLKLTSAQFQEYQKNAGQGIVQAMKDQMEGGNWEQLSDKQKIEVTKKVQTQVKKQTREELLQQPGWLNSKQMKTLGNATDDE